MATAQSPNDLTRQQLDELDALLQRMLALPLDTPSAPAVRPTMSELPLPEITPSNRVGNSTPYIPAIPSTPLSPANREGSAPTIYRGEQPAPPGPQLLTVASPNIPPATAAARPSAPPPTRVHTTPSHTNGLAVQSIEQALSALAKPREKPDSPLTSTTNLAQALPKQNQPGPALLSPLVSFNRLLNLGLDRLGFFGRVLQTGFARNLLALLGFFLLASIAARFIESRGWVVLPITFPWPQ